MDKAFLFSLLDHMSVSGHEIPLQKKVIAHMAPICHEIRTDYTGNVLSILNPQAPFKVMLAAHIDEIGLIVTHIQPDGLLRVGKSGGIHPYQYPGHQVVIHGHRGPVYGVVVASKDTEKGDLKVSDLYIDIGARDEADARRYVQQGDPAHIHSSHRELCGGLLSARAIDNRGCAFIILEAVKRAKAQGCRIGVYAATTAGEETTKRGAYWAGSAVAPDVAIVVDVTYASDYPPGLRRRGAGERPGAVQQLHRQPQAQRASEGLRPGGEYPMADRVLHGQHLYRRGSAPLHRQGNLHRPGISAPSLYARPQRGLFPGGCGAYHRPSGPVPVPH